MREEGRKTLLYVAGAGRSGSTLLSFLLNTHPEVFSIGEMRSPESGECSCGCAVRECPFMTAVSARLAEQGIALDPGEWSLEYRHPTSRLLDRVGFQSLRSNALEAKREAVLFQWPPYRRAVQELDRRVDGFMRAALSTARARIFVDATKAPIRIRHLRRIAGWNLKVVHLVRDPRGVTYSNRSRGEAVMRRVPSEWVRLNTGAERQLRELSADEWVRIRYEDLCMRPGETLELLGRFVGIGPIPVPENFRAREHHLQNGNLMRRRRDGRTAIELDERWRRGLPEDLQRAVADVAGPLARRYGYEDL